MGKRKEVRVGTENEAWKVVSSPFGQGGVTIAIQEVTEIERAQREVARVHRLAEIGQMTAAVAHEIRNPLTGILSAAQLGMSDPDSSQTCLDIVREEANKLNGLCDDFLDFARPLKLNLTEMNLNQVVTRVLDRHRADVEAAHLKLICDLDVAEPSLQADPDRFEQILHNLVRNAIQATPAGGEIRIATHAAGLSIEDTGCGMADKQMESLFTPFFTTKSQGTGLGLCNARKILDAHGASVSVRSSLGKGTRFDISWGSLKAA
jgi:signal transduction histidine kinase